MQILNIAAYKFVPLGELAELQEAVRQELAQLGACRTWDVESENWPQRGQFLPALQAHSPAMGQKDGEKWTAAANLQPTLPKPDRLLGIKGTVLLAEEGINLFLAGPAGRIHAFLSWLRRDTRFADLEVKESWSSAQPFRKLLVKVKREIIRMDRPAIAPSAGRAPAVDAGTLKRWLDTGHDDAGQPVVTLDTRNAFEADVGTFKNAIDWRIGKFTEFPQALLAHREELQGKTVVSFCTGGIRCEKAAILMREAGVTNVYQLDGGILKYFEEAGHAHFDGECFVFDERRALDPALKPQVDASAANT